MIGHGSMHIYVAQPNGRHHRLLVPPCSHGKASEGCHPRSSIHGHPLLDLTPILTHFPNKYVVQDDEGLPGVRSDYPMS
jgi:hypothetical protein